MLSLTYAVGMMLKVTAVFLLLYVFIPSRVAKFEDEAAGRLDRFFISFIHGTFITIIIVLFLVGLKLYDVFSLVFCLIVVYIFIIKYRGKSWQAVLDALGMQLVVRLLDMSEEKATPAKLAGHAVLRLKDGLKSRKRELFLGFMGLFVRPFSGILPLLAFLAAACIRFKPALTHAAFLHIDMYLHMIWVKYLGLNQIFPDGVYPFGYHALVSALNRLSFIDPYWLLRFLGPLGGTLIVLSVYYFVLRVTKNPAASLVSLLVFGIVITDFPGAVFRQTAALTQEFGLIYILPGLYFLWLYLKTKKTLFVMIYAEALACTLFIHSYSALYLMIWSAVMVLCAMLFGLLNLRVFRNLIVFGLAAGVVAMAPLGIGYLFIGEFHESSIKFLQEGLSAGSASGLLQLFWQMTVTRNPFLAVIIPAAALIIIYSIAARKREETPPVLAVLFSALLMYALYRAPAVHLPTLTDPDRTMVFFSLILASYYAAAYHAFDRVCAGIGKNSRFLSLFFTRAVMLVLCLAIVVFYRPVPLYRGMEEYDAAAQNYLKIKSAFPSLDWTIIGPQEQLAQSLNYGWHSDLIRFVKSSSLEEAGDPVFDMPYPTTHIFIFTEKKPLGLGRAVTPEDALKELESEKDDPFMQYYKNAEQRAILEAKAILWAETYKNSHDNADIFYEDEDIRIYHIEHEPRIEQTKS